MRTISSLVLVIALATTTAASSFTPPRRLDGSLPPMPPPTVVGWLEEAVDLTVDADGLVSGVDAFQSSAQPLLASVAGMWHFRPAALGRRPVSSHVLAVALIRPPQLYDGPALGGTPDSITVERDDLPAPTVMQRPRYPPRAVGDALVLVEVLVGAVGHVHAAAIAESASGFDDEALIAARHWVFRPAHVQGDPVAAYVYIAFGFRQPQSNRQEGVRDRLANVSIERDAFELDAILHDPSRAAGGRVHNSHPVPRLVANEAVTRSPDAARVGDAVRPAGPAVRTFNQKVTRKPS